jgi:pimeloyl-ACP methyl ester carboxylesterase
VALTTGGVDANGVRFHYLEAGQGPLALCLHGFPDDAHTYSELLPALARAGFRGVAPFMRGYAPSSPAPDGRYQAVLLAQDALALIAALGGERAFVVGHDWGATAAYGAAALAPERIARLVTIGAAHPAAFRGPLATSYERHKGIWHAYFFQMPFAEQVVAADDFAYLEAWWRDASPEFDPTPVIERVKATFRRPGVLAAALSYYRHTFHPANRDPALQALQERASSAPTAVPTLALHGTRDRPGRLEAFEGMDDLFSKGLEKVVLPGAGHFVHVERPAEVNRRIVEFFQARKRRPS